MSLKAIRIPHPESSASLRQRHSRPSLGSTARFQCRFGFEAGAARCCHCGPLRCDVVGPRTLAHDRIGEQCVMGARAFCVLVYSAPRHSTILSEHGGGMHKAT